ncbi:AAA domain-containing protein [Cloacibacillus porcorum]|uniref:Uncharacterized protein n=1 Tax=Cloacibacillus porcorum TaxID=1197717 RepID=A0A1B2I4P8_9BACT|nr:AAA domain-containing protein [Cloacibacillus porcorum]ANZ44951.1 hypothetical protein BED41_07615 [Cloacibacillus porcorum]
MTPLENAILDIIKGSNGVKASQIANELNIDKKQVNSLLYGNLKVYCCQDSSYKWYLASAFTAGVAPKDDNVVGADKDLENLCKYYLNCLSIEGNNSISAFLTSSYNLNYAEVNKIDKSGFDSENAAVFLNKIARQRNMTAYVGYPIMIMKIYSLKTKQSYLKVVPIFIFSLEYGSGSINMSNIPSLNMEIIKRYTPQDSNAQIYELIDLENQLGLNSQETEIEIDELVVRLQEIRHWEWKEKLDPYNLNLEIPIGMLTQEGIYNKAVVIATERSPYTQGLESELSALSQLSTQSYKDTALYNWVHREGGSGIGREAVQNSILQETASLEVLPLNTEQDQAIQKALKSNLIIVTGPPGTGKSQVVTSLLVNAAWNNKNALFTSKNNKAVDVVDIRVNNLGNRPIMLRIGNNQYAYRLAEVIEGLLSSNADQSDVDDFNYYKTAYDEKISACTTLKRKKNEYIAFRNRLDRLEQKVCHIREKTWGAFLGKVDDEDIKKLRNAVDECTVSYSQTRKEQQSFLTKIFWFVVKDKRKQQFEEKVSILNNISKCYGIKPLPADIPEDTYIQYKNKIVGCINDLQTFIEYSSLLNDFNDSESLENIDRQLIAHKSTLADIAHKLWEKWLVTCPLQISAEKRVEMTQYVAAMRLIGDVDVTGYPEQKLQFSKLQKEMAQFMPCWAVTSLSVKGRIPFQPGFFDMVIIDEASQCDIASILPLLYRAKRAIIIGDPKQLSHISSVSKSQDVSLLQKYKVGFEWSYSANSLYSIASGIANPGQIVHLRDHHRSFGDIIEFSNTEFYEGKLRIATDYKRLNTPGNEAPGVRWVDVSGKTIRPSTGGAYNNQEIEKVISELKHLIVENGYCGSVGVVTPFKSQAEKIREIIEKTPSLKDYLHLKNDFLVDTVHKFQGDERDVMIFSPVISQDTPLSAISFLNNTGNLFNVAITRARSMLIVVGDMQYCSECKISYMEHFVDYIRKHLHVEKPLSTLTCYESREYPRVDNPEQVSDWERYFYTELFDAGIKTVPQYPVDKYKLDLALFFKDRMLDIEVDGEMYHRDWNGELCYRDQLRNQRLYEIGWDVKRFWVYQIRDALPWCIEQIREWMKSQV